jgi:hypothetical protein
VAIFSTPSLTMLRRPVHVVVIFSAVRSLKYVRACFIAPADVSFSPPQSPTMKSTNVDILAWTVNVASDGDRGKNKLCLLVHDNG